MTDSMQIGRILVLDDSTIDQMAYKRVLARSTLVGTAVAKTDAAEALDYLSDPRNEPFDVVLLDVNMPRMTGIEFLQAARHDGLLPRLGRVWIMLTSALTAADEASINDFDVVQGCLEKPLTEAHLATVASSVQSRFS